MTFYHFTSLYHLPKIQEAGVIRTTESNISRFAAHAGPPVVWLTDLPELQASHGLEGSLYDKKQVRIEVRVPAIRWLDWEPMLTGMEASWRDDLIAFGGGMEAARNWYVWPSPIRKVRWGGICKFPDRPDRMVRRFAPDGTEEWVPAPAVTS
jgi:hypothetical protein